jgi:hypothetical protein
MSEIDTLKAEIKRLSTRAITMKMNLHDLSEELPINWETIPSVAEETFKAYRDLTEARAKLKQAEKA